ncbi:hypothetical protein AC579_6687 [Pseudocercospora musae]|uniref:Uncharacterized protein n=1 Tax=Pseudocercospora musae TaxID=113226 RepID=A0A139HSQ4_9PEZI|nr:hypothetical protein AC579_6687 [Pseudocercospora musae]KXT05490.1 hypothetical protein AC579_6687 [Pseudocercospora musae]
MLDAFVPAPAPAPAPALQQRQNVSHLVRTPHSAACLKSLLIVPTSSAPSRILADYFPLESFLQEHAHASWSSIPSPAPSPSPPPTTSTTSTPSTVDRRRKARSTATPALSAGTTGQPSSDASAREPPATLCAAVAQLEP